MVRVALTTVVLYLVWGEAGPATAAALALIAWRLEMDALAFRRLARLLGGPRIDRAPRSASSPYPGPESAILGPPRPSGEPPGGRRR